MGKLVKRLIKSQILASNSFVKIRNNNLFSFKTAPDFFANPLGGPKNTIATGGTITQVGDYKVHTFYSSGNFEVTSLGSAPNDVVEYLIIAGGGGAGVYGGGGGGAGGFRTASGLSIAVQSYPVIIGSGGSKQTGAVWNSSPSVNTNGNNSSFNSIISIGGGRGGNYADVGAVGGSGGGGGFSTVGGNGTASQGNNGGAGAGGYAIQKLSGGGGGGAGTIGDTGNNSIITGANGGNGLQSSISGTSTYYSGGGAGGKLADIPALGGQKGLGGLGGGGDSEEQANAPLPSLAQDGFANTGGGGGGTSANYAGTTNPNGGNGGSGIVMIKYFSPKTDYTFPMAFGGIVTTLGNYRIHTFKSSGDFVVSELGTAPNNVVEYLVVSGGGGGSGPAAAVGNGGGGAGGYLTNTGLSITAQTYSVIVGSGGNGGTGGSSGSNGVSSSFNSVTPFGGGKGQACFTTNTVTNNGSGGGGAKDATPATPLGTVGQGNNGGSASSFGGGGGGGKGTVGATSSTFTGAAGGNGLASLISGTSVTYAGGGGGGGYNSAGGTAGTGGAGNGGSGTISPKNASLNTGSGGGGCGNYVVNPFGGNGGSGIVIIKYKFQDVPYLTTSQAYFNQVTANGGSLTEIEKIHINTFIGSLGTDFAEFDRLWIHGLSNSVAARTSLANPTSTMITAVNSPTFTANQGYNGNGTTSYLNTNYNPTTNGVKYTLNSASLYVYSRTDSNNSKIDIGHSNATSYATLDLRDGGSFYRSINQAGLTNNVAVANSLGLFSGVRLANQDVRSFKNGISLSTQSTDSTLLINNNMYVLALNSNGTASNFSARQLSVSGIGSGIINQSTFYTTLQVLGTSLGWAI